MAGEVCAFQKELGVVPDVCFNRASTAHLAADLYPPTPAGPKQYGWGKSYINLA